MRFSLTALCRSASKITFAALCMTTWLAAGQVAGAAYGVTVNQQGDTLVITGNDNPNTVSIVGAEDDYGTVGVYVVDVPWVYEGINHIHVDLAGGDNVLAMDRIEILGDLTVLTGEGRDEVDLGGWGYGASAIGGAVEISTAGGRDRVAIEDTWVAGNVTIDTAAGGDIVEIGDDGILFSIVGDSVERRTADGGYVVADSAERETTFSDLSASPDDGEEAKFIVGLVYAAGLPSNFNALSIFTGAGRDQVGITGTEVEVETVIELGSDDDRLRLQHPNEFYGSFTARGQQGTDHLFDDPGNFYESPPQFLQFELP